MKYYVLRVLLQNALFPLLSTCFRGTQFVRLRGGMLRENEPSPVRGCAWYSPSPYPHLDRTKALSQMNHF